MLEHKIKKDMKPLDFFAYFIRDDQGQIVGGCAGDNMYRGFIPLRLKKNLQPGLFDESGISLDNELIDQLNDSLDIQAYQRKKYPVRKSIPSDIPREIVMHDIPDAEKICACGTPLVCIGQEVSEQIKYIPATLNAWWISC
jgi:hypothetical protein